MIEHRVVARPDQAGLVAAMAPWDAAGAPVPALHPGDLGWSLRDPDGVAAVHAWWEAGELVAVALTEGSVARPRLAPGRQDDAAVGAAVADVVDALPGPRAWCDREPGGDNALAAALADRGWVPDAEEPWVCLHLDLTTWPGPDDDATAERADGCPEDRVAAQLAGFANSTFSLEKWGRMAAGPVYDPGLDLLVRAADGSPAASGTAWLAVRGGTALLEPISTHRDHRRAGHARRVVHALAAACRERGAGGVTVWTPQGNEGAVPAYAAAGMVVVDTLCGMVHERGSATPATPDR